MGPGVEIVSAVKPIVIVERVETEVGIGRRLAVGNEPAKWSFVDDDGFLKSMADAGSPTGMVALNGQVLLMPR